MNEITLSKDDPAANKWIVRFTDFRVRGEHQRRVIEELGLMAHEVVRVWLNVMVPEAIVREPPDQPIRHVAFSSRSQMRRFIAVFGGRHIRLA